MKKITPVKLKDETPQKCPTLLVYVWHIIRLCLKVKDKSGAKKSYGEHDLVRRKYILSQVSAHFDKNRFEPAPLLNLQVLELGGSNCAVGESLTLRGADVTCIERTKERLDKEIESAEKFGAPMTFLKATAEDLVREKKKFDIILDMNILKGSDDIHLAMERVSQLLNPNGLVVLSSCYRGWLSWFWHVFLVEKCLKWRAKGNYPLKRFLSPSDFKEALEQNDLSIVHQVDLYFDPVHIKWRKTQKWGIRYLLSAKSCKK